MSLKDIIKEEECPCCRYLKEELGMLEAAPIDELRKRGFEFPEAGLLTDEAIVPLLWQLIGGLADLHIYLEDTNHLNDRQFYEVLNEQIREVMMYSPNDAEAASYVGFVDSEDTDTWLRYYADARTRRDWRRQFPDAKIPAHERLPYHRDALLPRPNRGSMLPA